MPAGLLCGFLDPHSDPHTLLTEPSSSLIQKGSLLLFLAFFPQALDTHLHIWMLTPAW